MKSRYVSALILVLVAAFCLVSCQSSDGQLKDLVDSYNSAIKAKNFPDAARDASSALNLSIQASGWRNVTSLQIAGDLGYLLTETGELSRAESLLVFIEPIIGEMFGENSISISTTYSNLADLYKQTERFDLALNYYERVIRIRRDSDHQTLVLSYRNLAEIYCKLGQPLKALEPLGRCFKCEERILSEWSPDHTVSQLIAASVYMQLGDYSIADSLLERARQIGVKYWGVDRPFFIDWYRIKGDLDFSLEKFEEAKKEYYKSFELISKYKGSRVQYSDAILGIAYTELLTTRYDLAIQVYDSAHNFDPYLPVSREIYCGNVFLLGAVMCGARGDIAEADSLFAEAEDKFSAVGDGRNSYICSALHAWSDMKAIKGDLLESKRLRQRAIDLAEVTLGLNAPRTIEMKK